MGFTRPNIRVLAFMQAAWVTGPAKNLLQFASLAAEPAAGSSPVHLSLVVFRRGSRNLPIVDAARGANIPVHVVAERYRFDLAVVRQIRQILETEQPDVVQTHDYKTHALIRSLRIWQATPWIAFHHGYTATDWKDSVYNRLGGWSMARAHRVVTVCAPFTTQLRRSGVLEDRIVVRHNSVPPFNTPAPERIAQARAALGVPFDAAVILCVGRLSREKAHADLLEAAALMNRGAGPPFRVVIVGDGPENAALRDRCRALALDRTVVFAGHRDDVPVFYSLADVLVLPSHSEGSPNVLLEAMAAGVPVIATAVGGVPEIIDDGRTGVLVPPGRPEIMAEAIAALLAHDKLRLHLAAEARCSIENNFSPAAYCQSLVRVYQDLLAANR